MKKNPEYPVLVGPTITKLRDCTRLNGTRVPVEIIWQGQDGTRVASSLIVSEFHSVDDPARMFFALTGYVMGVEEGPNGFVMEWNTKRKKGHIQFTNERHPEINPSLLMKFEEHGTRRCAGCSDMVDARDRFCLTCSAAVINALRQPSKEYLEGADIHPARARGPDDRENTYETKHGTGH